MGLKRGRRSLFDAESPQLASGQRRTITCSIPWAVRGCPHAEGSSVCLLVQPVGCGRHGLLEPDDSDRGLLTFDGQEPLSLQPGDGVLIPVKREEGGLQDGSLCEAVLCVEGQVEAIPGVWDTGAVEGSISLQRLTRTWPLSQGMWSQR